MDFGLLPPEVNSGRMYTGPGPESMLAAAAAWDTVAAELSAAAVSYGSVVSALILEPWMGSAAAAMTAAATPYVGWLAATAAQVKETACQARMAASAFATAFASTVPPPRIAANRSRLMSLVAANILGQNSPAIAAIQAEYAEMWAQDAAAMHSYLGASATAATLTPFTEPIQSTDPPGSMAEAAAVAQAAGAAAPTITATRLAELFPGDLADSLSTLTTAADPLTSGLLGIATSLNPQLTTAAAMTVPTPIGELDVLALYIAAVATGSIALSVTNTFRPWNYYGSDAHGGGSNPTHGGAISSTRKEDATDWGPFGGAAPVTVGVGHAALVGSLSVPHGWTTAAPEIQLAVEAMRTGASSRVDSTALNGMSAGLLGGAALAGWAARGTIGGGRSSATDKNPHPVW